MQDSSFTLLPAGYRVAFYIKTAAGRTSGGLYVADTTAQPAIVSADHVSMLFPKDLSCRPIGTRPLLS